MPLQDFLAGAALFAVMLAAVGAATALIVRRRLRHLDALETGLASVVIATALLIAVHLLPLALGVLARGTVLVACALAVGLALLVRPAAPEPEPEPEPEARERPASGRGSWILALSAAAFTAAAALADLGRWAGDEVVGDDPTSFHLPGVGRWIQDGTMWQIDQFVPLLAQGYYPNNGDVVMLATILPWHNDFLVRVPAVLFLVATAVAVFAIARELRAPPAACVLAAVAIVSLPVVGRVTIPRALPDSLMWATFACGILFALRHARTARRSDLVLAAVALGLAAGTKWYGVSSVPVAIAVWAVARRGPALRDTALVSAIALAGMLAWLVRNLALAGNPLFPLKLGPFNAPPDIIRDRLGFSIADYATQPDVLVKCFVKVLEGLAVVPVLCAAGLAIAVVFARRRGRSPEPRVLVMAAAAVALGLLYTLTPATALGVRGDPSLAGANTRYAIPALLLAMAVVAWALPRMPRAAARAFEVVLAVGAVGGAYSSYSLRGHAAIVVPAAVGLALLAGAAWVVWRLRDRRVVLGGLALAAALVGLAAANRVQDRINSDRYVGRDPGLDALLRLADGGKRVGFAFSTYWSLGDLSPVWPAFGTRIDNDVEYVGHFVDGFLTPYRDERSFHAALRRGRYDVLAVGRSTIAEQQTPEQAWALSSGWRTISLSPKLRVLVPPNVGQP
jgi:hypothetical protein